jgi:hypothetical protein
MKRIIFSAIIVALILAGDVGFLEAVDIGGKTSPVVHKLTNLAGQPISTKININSISSWYQSNGSEERNPSTSNAGFDYPRGTSQAIYAAGLMYSGEFNDGDLPVIRTNGFAYDAGFVRGAILGTRTGMTEDPEAADVRIWRIRRDYNTADLRLDAAEINSIGSSQVSDAQIQAVRDQYQTDWLEWPAAKGAPFYDADSDGVYTPLIVEGKPTLFPDADEPGLAGADQVLWFTANDIRGSSPWGATPAAGLEMQLTVWGYARTDPLGEVIFKKYRLIYKGVATTSAQATIDNMYLSQWSDPDLGNSADDFAGCDTLLSLGFVYNGGASDAQYAAFPQVPAPPAVGYDFLQGPLVPGVAGQDRNNNGIDDATDTGVFDLKRTAPGFINLPMTSFVYFAAGGAYSDPPTDYDGAQQWNCMLQGFPPLPQPPPCPTPPTDPFTGMPAGKYWLYGGSDGSSFANPNAPNGWVDGMIEGPGDRRIILASGPFTMALGDTQELVSGVVGGVGNTYLKSMSVMKFNDRSVQQAYDNLFDLPKPPPPPDLKIVPLNGQLLLEWETDDDAVAATEETEFQGGYKFQGYKVYQFPTQGSTLADGILLGTFDQSEAEDIVDFDTTAGIKTIFQETFDIESGEILNLPVQFGTDAGVARTLVVTRDEFRSAPLVNGTPYYFGVTAYNFTADPTIPLKTLESSPIITVGIPATTDPGERYPYVPGDTVTTISKTEGLDASAFATVYNPTSQSGQTYEVRFDTTVNNVLGWTLLEVGGDTLYSAVEDLTGTTPYRIVSAGVDVFVQGAPVGIASITNEDGADVFGPESTNPNYAILSPDENIATINGLGQTNRNFELRFDGIGSWGIRLGTFPVVNRVVRLPFSVWDVGRTGDTTQVQVIAAFPDSAGGMDAVWDVTASGIVQQGTLYRVFEPISVISRPNPNDSLALNAIRNTLAPIFNTQTNPENALFRFFIADKDMDAIGAPEGTTISFNKYGETRGGDVMTIGLESVTSGDVSAARDDVTLINVFPNPYYGLNTRETSSQSRFVTFNHLPEQATIRIFNLAGVLVRTLVKDATTSSPTSPQHFQWNLQNDNGLPVASGIYLVYMELKDGAGVDLGNKFLKLAIIQEQQFLPNY